MKGCIERPDMLDDKCPEGLRVVQLTTDPAMPCAHVYMEAQVFSPDSKRFILERSGTAHGPRRGDPEHKYLLCDIDNGPELTPIIEELNARAPSFSPDGRWIYYVVDNTEPDEGSVELKRVAPDGSGRETLLVVDKALPGADHRPSCLYPLSTISSDGLRFVTGAYVGDKHLRERRWGIVRFDLADACAEVILNTPFILNSHPQYSRSLDPEHSRDILIQENHGQTREPRSPKQLETGEDDRGADIHVVRDDGTNLRTMPWGRDGVEFCQGHQCWRGRTEWAITSTWCRSTGPGTPAAQTLIESLPVAGSGHDGLAAPGGVRNDLTAEVPEPHFFHFATDAEGSRFISDWQIPDRTHHLYSARLRPPGEGPALEFAYLLDTGSRTSDKEHHTHPFLSPDGRRAFFNSSGTGTFQAYMIEGLE